MRRRHLGISSLVDFVETDAEKIVQLAAAKTGSSPAVMKRGDEVRASAKQIATEMRKHLERDKLLAIPELDVSGVSAAYLQLLREVRKRRQKVDKALLTTYDQGLSSKRYFQTLADLPNPTTEELEDMLELSSGSEVRGLSVGVAPDPAMLTTATAPPRYQS